MANWPGAPSSGVKVRTEYPMPGLFLGAMGTWLAAVGVLRLLHQADPDAVLWWDGPIPTVSSRVYDPARWLADHAVFSPVVTPWQGGGGWGTKDKTPADRLARLRAAASPRLARLRAAVEAADQVLARTANRDKASLVRELRNWLPDDAIPWLDVAVPLTYDDKAITKVRWAPLAGTGGNDGRWDISTNYQAAVLDVCHDYGGEAVYDRKGATVVALRARMLATDLLGGTEHERLEEMSGGPYWPASNGLLNPWAMILTVEGLLAFGDRRLREWGEDRQPFTGDQESTEPGLGEAWLPMWDEPMTLPEVTTLLGGPWPRWRTHRDQGRAIRPGDVYRAFKTGGVPAGVTRFARYGLLQRKGLAHIAVPLEPVTRLDEPVWLSEHEAHHEAGVDNLATWRGYVSRGQAPGPDDEDGPRWLAGTIERYAKTRTGRGIRTDLG